MVKVRPSINFLQLILKLTGITTILLNSVLIFVILNAVNGFHSSQQHNHAQPPCSWIDHSSLHCFVTVGAHNLIVEESVAGRGPEHAASLWVHCDHHHRGEHNNEGHHPIRHVNNNVGSSNSGYVLSDGVFMSVKNLLELKFEHCVISGITPGSFDYFPHLQNFTLHASTSLTWPLISPSSSTTTTTASLSIKDVFRSLHKLTRLDLATTSLQIPSDFLCLLPSSLTHLNLSSTSLHDLHGISPSDPTIISHCGNSLISLDLSYNYFNLLPPATFSSLIKLESLHLDYNLITTVAERGLLGLASLRKLSLVGNSIKSLAPQFFKDTRLLNEIYLQNNSLSIIAPGLFNNLEYLLHLDLSYNELSSDWINGDTFRGLRNLNYLSLAHNELSRIDSSLFRDLISLQVLILSYNQFKVVSASSICGGGSGILPIDNNGQYSLRFLALDNNKIEHIAAESFKNCSKIEDLNLSGNKLNSIPNSLASLTHLRYIDLGENNITNLTGASYQKLYNLAGLRLTDNSITSLDANSFRHLTSLKIVNLAKNNISNIEPGTFDHNLNLQALRLDSNRLNDVNVSKLVINLKNLLWLSLNENQLTELNYEELPSKLQWIELARNSISTISGSIEASRITKLDLSDNKLIELGSAQLPDSLVQLSLRNNTLNKIKPYTFLLKENITLIDLSYNKLSNLDQNVLRLNGLNENNAKANFVEVLLSGNEFNCDCSMQWLQELHASEYNHYHDSKLAAVQDYRYPIITDAIHCSPQPYYSSFDGISSNIANNVVNNNYIFLCKYNSRCLPSCHCCGFNCDCELSCPTSCSCYNDQGWSINIVDCSNTAYNSIPAKIPIDLTELRLDGNSLPVIEPNSFFPHKYLKSLYLNSSQVETLSNKSFHGLHALVILHLENNFIEKLDGYEFNGLINLEELYLQQNSLYWIGNETFSRLSRLRILWLQQNNFVQFELWNALSVRMNRLAEVRLGGSDYSCECEYYTAFKAWLIEYGNKIGDVETIHCVDTISSSVNNNKNNIVNKSELLIVKLLDERNPKCISNNNANNNNAIIGRNNNNNNNNNHDSSSSTGNGNTHLSILEPSSSSKDDNLNSFIIPLVIGIVSLVLFLILVSILVMYWRESLQIWFHANCGLRLHVEQNEDKLFDAFISYSSKDEAWVRQVLASELERHSPPYRLCLRYRDIPIPGSGTYLADTLVSAFEASKRTILVLSHHFLKGEWNRIEVKSAHAQLFKDRTNNVIILILGDLPPNIDPEIRLYLKTHRKNTIVCDDKRFWDKLHYCMPDVKMKVPLHGSSNHSHLHHQHSHNHHQAHHQQQQTAQLHNNHNHVHNNHNTNRIQHSHSRSNSSNSGSCSLYNNSSGNYCTATTTGTNSTSAHSYSSNSIPQAQQQPQIQLPQPPLPVPITSHTNHNPNNMIVCNNSGNNRNRHVAIHI